MTTILLKIAVATAAGFIMLALL